MEPSVLGVLLSVLAAMGFGLFAVLARPAMLHASFYLGILVSLTASLLTVAAIAFAADAPGLFEVSPVALAWFAAIGLVNFCLGRLFNLHAIHRIGVSRAAPLIGTTPLFAALLAFAVYGEGLGPLLIAGILLVVAGVVLILRESG
jgi:drug/metabolite transporter (DMT)-like permease